MTTDRDSYPWVALSVTTVGALLASVQGSALLIALPSILKDLHSSFLTIMWVLLGYLLITTALVPIIGRIADIVGRKALYNAGFAIFTLGSLLAGFAQPQYHGWDLVLYRVVQSVGGALLITNSTAIVTDAFKRGRVGLGLGVNQIAGAAGFVLGPVVGGLLTSISWHWIFWFNVPLGIFGTLWGIWRLRDPVRLPTKQTFDWPGSLTFFIGLGCLLLGVSLLAFPLFGPQVNLALLIAAALSLIAFFWIELRTAQPMFDLGLFRDRLFAFANLANALNGLARGAVLFVLIFFLQGPYGQNPLSAGLMLAPFGLAFMAVGPASGALSDRIGSRLLATLGLVLSSVALLLLTTITQLTPYWLLAAFMVLLGMGSGLFSSPNTNAIMSSVLPNQRGVAAGMRTMLANTGQMLSIAVIFPLVLSQVPENLLQKVFLNGGGLGDPRATRLFDQGLHGAFWFCFAVSIVAAALSYLRPSHGLPAGEPHQNVSRS
jgi:EmrB/QacA subfamily drug resistance transporter